MTDVLAAARARRVSALFASYGEAWTRIRAGVNRAQSGLFTPMDGPTLGTYFDGNESVGLLHPALALYSDGADTDPPAANYVFYRDGRLWTIRKTQVFRLVSTPLLILSLCD
jgi:hypothetical protein